MFHCKFAVVMVCVAVVIAPHAGAQELFVPSQYSTIQSAVNAAPDGATIIVAPGTYEEAIYLQWEQTVTIISEQGPQSTIIDATDQFDYAIWADAPGHGSRLEGFTIRGSDGGVTIEEGGLFTIAHCIFDEVSFGAVSAWGANLAIEQTSFLDNTASSGGAAYLSETTATFVDCHFSGNTANFGGAVRLLSDSVVTFTDCTFENNSATSEGGAVNVSGQSVASFDSCTFADNEAEFAGGAIANNSSTVNLFNSTFCGNSSDIFGSWNDQGGNTFEAQCPFKGCNDGFQTICHEPDGDIISCSFSCWSAELGELLTIGEGPHQVTANWSINTFNKGWFSAPGNEIAHAVGITDVSQITDASQFSFVSSGSVGPVCDAICSPTGVGEFVIIRNQTSNFYGVLRVDEINFVNVVPPLEAYMSGRWWFQTNGSADFSGDSGPPRPQVLEVPSQYPTIQAAIDAAAFDNDDTVLVAPGIYNEAINFGGKTINVKSESGAAVTTIDASMLDQSAVVVSAGSGEGTRLEGFTITGGNALEGGVNTNAGGGLRIMGSTVGKGTTSVLTVVDCVFVDNTSQWSGGGVAVLDNAIATFENCTFENNITSSDGGASGGGAYVLNAQATFTDCVFIGNGAELGGGLSININTTVSINNTSFVGNTADTLGGGVLISPVSVVDIDNCTISGNTATGGGGLYISAVGSFDPAVVNVASTTICNNTPDDFAGEAWIDGGGNIVGELCIPDNNTPDAAQPVVAGKPITGTFAAATNDGTSSCEPDGVDVFFVYTVAEGPETLELDTCGSAADTALAVFDASETELGCSTSCTGDPCSGSPACLTLSNLPAGEYLIRLSQVPSSNLGLSSAYVLNITAFASGPLGDLNGDGVVNVSDLLILLSQWGSCADPNDCQADLNNDGEVNVSDLLILLANWG